MSANKLGEYIWLIDILRRRKRLTFDEINNLWKKSGLSYGEEDDINLRTFHNHKKAISDIFDVDIECDREGYSYYIDNPEHLENDGLRSWLIDSFATLNQIKADSKMHNRVQFETIPSGHKYLSDFMDAMRNNQIIEITHLGFKKEINNTFEIEPYYLKVYNCRWYVIANNPYYNKILTYALDRIQALNITEKKFEMPKDFDINDYFDGCCGIINDKNIPIERIVIKANNLAEQYIDTLPIHSSQKVLSHDETSTTYEINVRPTFDFIQKILKNADQVEVLEPASVRNEIKKIAENLFSYYK